ncbi:hypothetical protein LH464_05410 [Neorhizobium sp. T786]|uniref:hypothetical protein n=1 Tax=Pseudorhizobium xiangyangii TaxID=2883104 RepID=UPI001CFF7B38|nr:hypothetical protein [Neorhizobium xiangyangii]MCB5201916.1 hypothetical protein [Neorhizobium xiangyangii]
MNITSDELIAIHAEQRAKERYGIELSDADRADMIAQVKDGRGLFFKKKEGSSKVSIWLVWWAAASRIVPIYYKTGRVLTVLPTDAFFGPTPPPQSNLRWPSWWRMSPEMEMAFEAYEAVEADLDDFDGDRRGHLHALARREHDLLKSISYSQDPEDGARDSWLIDGIFKSVIENLRAFRAATTEGLDDA